MDWLAWIWNSSDLWEGLEYCAEVTVIAGAVVEVLADFEHILKGPANEHKRKQVEKKAAITLIIGLAVGLIAVVRTNKLFTVEIEDANNRAIAALDRANREGEARLALEESIAWRRLTMPERNALANQMKRYAGERAVIVYNTGDKEGETFARGIADALHDAGWNVDAPASLVFFAQLGQPYGLVPPMETGVGITGPSNEAGRVLADSLACGLASQGYDATRLPDSRRGGPGTELRINVAVRPEGLQGDAKLRSVKTKPSCS